MKDARATIISTDYLVFSEQRDEIGELINQQTQAENISRAPERLAFASKMFVVPTCFRGFQSRSPPGVRTRQGPPSGHPQQFVRTRFFASSTSWTISSSTACPYFQLKARRTENATTPASGPMSALLAPTLKFPAQRNLLHWRH